MDSMLVDNEMLSVTIPDGFREMSLDELKTAYGLNYNSMWGVRDENRHIMIAVIWKDSGRLFTKIASEKSIAERAEKALSRHYKPNGYTCNGFFETTVAGAEAQGFRYAYQMQGIAQTAETLVFKQGKRCYTLYYYTRPEFMEENRPVYEGILASLALN